RTRFVLLFIVWLLTNLCAAWTVSGQLAVLVNDHDRIRAGRPIDVQSFLHTRSSSPFHVSSCSYLGCFICPADGTCWRSAIRIWPITYKSDVSFGNSFLQPLILAFRNEYR